jgi:Ser/Thr protein kinase RdoA (MazF antagonist)
VEALRPFLRGSVVVEEPRPREVVRALGLSPLKLRRVGHRFTNDHWRVAAVEGDFYLRRSAAGRSLAAVSDEVRLLQHLVSSAWPVPRPFAAPISVGGRIWTAFEALTGAPRRPRSDGGWRDERKARGRLLGELHLVLEEVPSHHQRSGFHRAEESFDSLEAQLVGLARTRPEEARRLGRHLQDTRSALDDLEASARPVQLIHGDFSTWNLLFSGGRLTGVLDFDLSHVNHRVADFAISWRGVHDDVIRSYHDVNPLTPDDRQLLVPVFRAWYLWQATTKFVGPVLPDPQLAFVLGHLDTRPTIAT